MATPPTTRVADAQFYGVMVVLLLIEILGSLEGNLVMSALPTLVRQFKDVTSVGWLVTAFGLAQAATAAIGGRLGDLFGRGRVLLGVVAVCGLGSLVSAFAPNLGVIILGRTLQGASGAILPLCYGITRELAAPSRAPMWIGLLTGGYAFSAAIAYILGGVLSDTGNWTSIFYVTAGLSVVALPLMILFVPKLPGVRGHSRIDWLGAALFAPGVASLLFALTQASKVGWGHADILGFLGAGVALLAYWAWHELRVADPLIDVRLLRRRPVAVGNICACLACFGVMQLPLVILMFMQQPRLAGVGLGVSATMAGLLKLPSNISSLAAAPFGGWVSGRNGARWAVLHGGLAGALGWGMLIFFHDTVLEVVAGSVVAAIGSNILLSALPNIVLEGAPMERSSEVTGMLAVVRAMAAAVGAQCMTIFLASSSIVDPATGAKLPSENAYMLTFGVIVATSLACGLVGLAARANPVARAAVAAPAE